MKKALFLVNPVAGRLSGCLIKERLHSILPHIPGWTHYDIEFTVKDMSRQITALGPEYRTIVIVGGDGSVSHAVRAIAVMPHQPHTGIIPAGTGNDLARSLGLMDIFTSHGLEGLLRLFARDKTVSMDVLGLQGISLFASYFGIGNDAKIAHDFSVMRNAALIKRLRSRTMLKAVYGILACKNALYRIPGTAELHYRDDGGRSTSLCIPPGFREILVANITSYAGGVTASSKTRGNDGRFEVIVIRNAWQWLMLLAGMIFRKPLDLVCPGLVQFQTDRCDIDLRCDSWYQIDGETLRIEPDSTHRFTVEIAAQVRMLVP